MTEGRVYASWMASPSGITAGDRERAEEEMAEKVRRWREREAARLAAVVAQEGRDSTEVGDDPPGGCEGDEGEPDGW